jgi:hypothetical protein
MDNAHRGKRDFEEVWRIFGNIRRIIEEPELGGDIYKVLNE